MEWDALWACSKSFFNPGWQISSDRGHDQEVDMNSLSIEFICGMTAGILAGDVETHAANDSTGIYS